jgi:hypothetical protein
MRSRRIRIRRRPGRSRLCISRLFRREIDWRQLRWNWYRRLCCSVVGASWGLPLTENARDGRRRSRNRTAMLRRSRRLGTLDHQNNAFAIGTHRVGVCAVHVHNDARDGRVRIVQAYAYALDAVGVQHEMFLFRVRESPWKGEYEPVRINCGIKRGLHGPGEDYFNSDIQAVSLDLQLLNLECAAFCALCYSTGVQEEKHEK